MSEKNHEVPRFDVYDWDEMYDPTGKIHFGMQHEALAKSLRALAERIQNGDVTATSGCIYSYARTDDYPMTCLVLRFHQKGIKK